MQSTRPLLPHPVSCHAATAFTISGPDASDAYNGPYSSQPLVLAAVQLPDYPFEGHRFEARPGVQMHYLDEGPRDGEIVLMLHGNPSWSYYWRHLVLGLRDRYRCIVPDHIGMGFSDKPDDAPNALPRYDYAGLACRGHRRPARASRRRRSGDAGGARLGRHDRFRLGA